ncbi:asparaginase [Nitriliruptor alkaliphilus]|uniref:asparaginase n=1 Tax=Nitriliruptor alkaliphilus TaxID=427918 RepID=UPI000698B6EB|nr:asparaginase [Nitriliruptor alkaliphilus]
MTRAVPLAEVTRQDGIASGSGRGEVASGSGRGEIASGSGRGEVASGSGREIVESRHVGHLVVTGPAGVVVAAYGDRDRPTFVRSTAKPFQATACLELLGREATDLTGEEVALSWSSHRAEPIHVAAARRLLARSGTAPDELTCPPATGEEDPAGAPERILHNCSGKHGLFALAGRRIGTPRADLLDVAGPLQRATLAALTDALGAPVAVGVDGCGAPAVAVPLVELARGFSALATEDRWRSVRDAGLAHPQLVGGRGRLESALLTVGVVAKVGAEGVFAAGWRSADGAAHGLAVKAEDGAERAATVAAFAALVDAGVVAADVWSPPPVLGGGRPVGRVRPVLRGAAGAEVGRGLAASVE